MDVSGIKREGSTRCVLAAIIAVVACTMVMLLAGCSGGSGVASKASTNDYTWDELSKISQEIGKASDENAAIDIAKKYNLTTADGKLDGTQTKDVTLSDGTQTSVQIAGFYHDDKSDGSGKAGITFIFTDAIDEHDMNSTYTNAGGWEDSVMRSWLASDGMELLPADLQSAIVAVDKFTNNVGETESVSSVTKTSDKLWLFAPVELCGEIDWWSGSYAPCNDVLNAEGTQYKLYRDAGISDEWDEESNAILAKTYDGASCNWWERSPYPNDSGGFCHVDSSGDPRYYGYAHGSYGVVPGFCL